MKFISLVLVLIVVTCCLDSAVAQTRPARRPGAEARRKANQPSAARDVARLLREFDKNGDAALDGTELPEAWKEVLATLDTDKNGKLDRAELQKLRGRPGEKAGEIITAAARGERYDDTLAVGDAAPDFTLADPTGKRHVTLSSFQTKRPVVLIFGSYT